MMLNNKIPPPIVALLFALAIYLTSRQSIVTIGSLQISEHIAYILFALGVLFILLANRLFLKASTTVNPMQPDTASSLVTDGIFSYSRNPMYLGMVLILFGLSVWLGSWLGFIWVLFFIGYIQRFQIAPEEAAMLTLFGEQYTQYQMRTRRWL